MFGEYFPKLLLSFLVVIFYFLLFADQKIMAACPFPNSGNATISSSCSIDAGTVDGVDAGTGSTNTAIITISGGTLTLNSNSTLLAGSFSLSGGAMAIGSGAQIKPGGAIYAVNSDGDGYFSENVWSLSGSTRRSSVSTFDCYDSNANAYPGSSYCSDQHRGDGSYDYNCDGVETFCGDIYNDGWN